MASVPLFPTRHQAEAWTKAEPRHPSLRYQHQCLPAATFGTVGAKVTRHMRSRRGFHLSWANVVRSGSLCLPVSFLDPRFSKNLP